PTFQHRSPVGRPPPAAMPPPSGGGPPPHGNETTRVGVIISDDASVRPRLTTRVWTSHIWPGRALVSREPGPAHPKDGRREAQKGIVLLVSAKAASTCMNQEGYGDGLQDNRRYCDYRRAGAQHCRHVLRAGEAETAAAGHHVGRAD